MLGGNQMVIKDWKKKIVPLAAASAIALAGCSGASESSDVPEETDEQRNVTEQTAEKDDATKTDEVKNIIFLIGDGMGVSYTSAYRYLKDDPTTQFVEKTAFDEYLVGQQMTYPEDPEENITDSAASATSMASGIKTYNNSVNIDNDGGTEVKTVLEAAKEQGKATGIVSTSEVTHATPASYGAHDPSRNNQNEIADDYFDEMIHDEHKIDVILGGGIAFFEREDRNLAQEFQDAGYSYVKTAEELRKDHNEKVLGLFAPVGMDKELDRPDEQPSLAEMTKEAIERLNQIEEGFFLMVEGSQIDWAGHDNDIVGTMSEMASFEEAFKVAIDFAKEDGHTLVVATADHSTGGFSLAQGSNYIWDPAPIKAANATPDWMAAQLVDEGKPIEEVLTIQNVGFELTDEEIQSVKEALHSGDEDLRTIVDDAIEKIYDTRSNTGWTTGGHTGEDVNVYAFGPSSEKFAGHLDNTDQAKIIFELIGAKVEIHDIPVQSENNEEE
jgi:alkaline phosphatase